MPTGNVRYINFKGTRVISANATSPIACFFAKSKRDEIPIGPNFLNEKKRLRKVGINPSNTPHKNNSLNIFSFLNRW